MAKILADYLEIYTVYPADAYLSKAQRKARHQALTAWANQKYKIMPTFEEIVAFMAQNETLKFEKPFLMRVLIPRVVEDVELGNTEMLKFLFECDVKEEWLFHNRIKRNYVQRKYHVQMLCEATNWEYNDWQLARIVLAKEPENESVMHVLYTGLERFLSYSIHEVPCGILAGINGADKEDMPQMFSNLEEFARLSKKLNKDDRAFIEECYTYYQAWETYLDHIEQYNGFQDYLEQQFGSSLRHGDKYN